jgi:heme exporter protein CcmD
MDFSASHIGFVLAAYALTAVLVAGLIIHVILRDRRLRAEAERLDRQRRKVNA